MSKYLIGAAAAAFLVGSTGAFALDDCSGDKTGWTRVPVGGAATTICYHGGSGNDVDCDSSGNHVVVTSSSDGYTILQHPQFGHAGHPQEFNQCIDPESVTAGDCDVTRANGTGNTSNFEFYCAG